MALFKRRVGVADTYADLKLTPPSKIWQRVLHFRDLAPATDAAQRALGEIAPTNIFDDFATELTKAYADLSPLKKFACKAGDWWRESAIGRTIALASGAVAGTSVITGGVAFLATGGAAAGAATYGVGIALAAIIAATAACTEVFARRARNVAIGNAKARLSENPAQATESASINKEAMRIVNSDVIRNLRQPLADLLNLPIYQERGPKLLSHLLEYAFERNTSLVKMTSELGLSSAEKAEMSRVGNNLRNHFRSIYTGPARTQIGPKTLHLIVCASLLGEMRNSATQEDITPLERDKRGVRTLAFETAYGELAEQSFRNGSKFRTEEFDFRPESAQLKIREVLNILARGNQVGAAATGVVGEFGSHLAEAKAADDIVERAKTNTKTTGGVLVVSANPQDRGEGVGLTAVPLKNRGKGVGLTAV